MDIAVKLDFEDSEGEGEINSSNINVNFECDDYERENHLAYRLKNVPEGSYSYNMITSPYSDYSPRKDYRSSSISDSPPYKKIRALRLFDAPTTPKTLLQKCAADSTSVPRQDGQSDMLFQSENEESNLADRGSQRICWNKSYDLVSTNRPHTHNRFMHESLRNRHTCDKENSTTLESPLFNKLNINSCQKSASSYVPTANINPFTPNYLMVGFSRKRTRSSLDSSNNNSESSSFCNCPGENEALTSSIGSTLNCSNSISPTDDDVNQPSKRLSIHEANVSRYHQEFLELSLIGRGQFGSVFKCRHRLDGCIYAIKRSLKPVAGSATERIALNEVYAHAVLGKHPHVVRYYSAWAENDHMIIQNEFCIGGSLADALEENKNTQTPFTEAQLKQVLLHVAKGLRYIHQQQLVHMDIKPGNIFISREPHLNNENEDSVDDGFEEEMEGGEESEDVVYKIGDLGHVTSVLKPQVEEGDCRYLPREILQEDFTNLQKADIFALGLTIYECATNAPLPLNGSEWHAIRDGHLQPIPAISSELQILLKLMVHPDPCERPTAAHLIQQLSYCRAANKSQAQLRRELNAEKLKNEILSRQLQEAAKCLQSISPTITSPELTATTVVTGVLAGVGPSSSNSSKAHRSHASSRLHDNRSAGPTTRNSRLVGKKVNRSVSATTF